MKTKNKIVLAGGNGFLGSVLIDHLAESYNTVIVLTRKTLPQKGNIHYHEWDGEHPGPWMDEINGADVLINLAGRSVNCRYNEANKKEILESRIKSTLALGAAVIMADRPPSVWINSSSATYYRNALDRAQDEANGETAKDFSMGVCQEWESVFFQVPVPLTRKVALRTSLVLGLQGGVLKELVRIGKLGLAGKAGSGSQMVSWIHEEDFASAISFIIDHSEIEGAINCTSPAPLPNKEFMSTLRRKFHLPFALPQSEWLVRLGASLLGTEAELLLKSRWVVPQILLQHGFTFRFPELSIALESLYHDYSKNHSTKTKVVPELSLSQKAL